MNTSRLMLLGLVLMPMLSFGGIETGIPAGNQVVLPSDAKWPTAEETRKALVAIHAFLEKPAPTNEHEAAAIKRILENLGTYRVQFFEKETDGKRLIWCNFFPAALKGQRDVFDYWRKGQVLVNDGGSAFWNISYDPSTGKCSKFRSNGTA